ncbi:MAG: proline--tRNA ligase [Patescibacteria group bacterium]|jgi:prolyl-tRNA synthetase
MRQSIFFSQTSKNTPANEASVNARFLTQGGFIHKTMAGVYTFLPLGWRVLNKIENIIRNEVDTVGQELLMPSLSPLENWEISKRLETVDVLLKVVPANTYSAARNNAEYILNPTHEDIITPIAKHVKVSHKDFPFAVYQIQTKFRNEERPKSGLLRTREFRMKDLYSFHTDEKDMLAFYARVKEVYHRIFDRLGIGDATHYVAASGGDFTENFSHEFQTECETGEDWIFVDTKTKAAYNKEIAPSRALEIFQEKELLPRKDVKGEGIIGVAELAAFLKVKPEQTTKTLIYVTAEHEPIVAAVRGDYEMNEIKLAKAAGTAKVFLADEKIVEEVTGAAVGYAGILDLKKNVRMFVDDALEHRVNFEVGANRTNYHTINANWGRDIPKPKTFYDIKLAKEGDENPETGAAYRMIKTSEVGNIFPLETKFSKAFKYLYTDAHGGQQHVYMASYGIGTSRTMGVLVEKFHDEHGIIWPKQVAPFHVHILDLTKDGSKEAEALEKDLTKKGYEVLLDDRKASPGEKFNDADLIGIPVRLVISEKTKGKIEWKLRTEREKKMLTKTGLANELKAYYSELS